MSGLVVWAVNLLAGLWKKPPVLAVLVINLIPAFCVLFFGWSALALLLLYWAENVVLGVINVFKMGVVSVAGGVGGVLMAIFIIPFFIVHYGAFCAGHGFFIVALLGGGFQGGDCRHGATAHRCAIIRGTPANSSAASLRCISPMDTR